MSLSNDQDILGYDANHFLQGSGIALDVGSNDLGSAASRLNLQLSGTDPLSVNAANGWLNVRDTTFFTLGNVTVDQRFDLMSVGAVDLAGDLTATSLRFDLGGALSASGAPQVNVSDELEISASAIQLAAAAISAGSARLEATAGALSVGDLSATNGDLSLLAGGALITSGIVDAQGKLIADAQSISMNNGSSWQGSGGATLTAIDDMSLQALTFGGDLDVDSTTGSVLFAGPVSALDIDVFAATGIEAQSAVTGSSLVLNGGTGMLVAGEAASLTSTTDGITLTGSAIALDVDSTVKSAGDFKVTSQSGDIVLGHVESGGRAELNSAGNVLLNRAVSSAEDLNVGAIGAVAMAAGALVESGGKVDIQAARLTMDAGSRLDA
ncbi:hypothetical protein, partial [Halopseudomonas sp.]|uniref:hypothetical protein n=1 Tax=Halopseudomonas sp. TaxID=2901191 RepID=UPI003561BC1F